MAQASANHGLLFIGPHWPRYDQASGDLRFHRLLRMTAEAGHRVDFVGLNETAMEGRYAQSLLDAGIRLRAGFEGFKQALQGKKDAVVFEYFFTTEELLPHLRLHRPDWPAAVDSVDVHFHRERLKAELSGDGDDIRRAEVTYRRETGVYRSVERVVAVTEEDRRFIHEACGFIPVDVVSNIHDCVMPPQGNQRCEDTVVFIGSFKHEPNVDGLLFFFKEVWPLVRAKRPQARMWVIGANPPSDVVHAADESVSFLDFVEDVTPYLHRATVSVAPLRFGAGMKGKVAEAMAHEIPVVMTSIGAQGMDLVHDRHAWIADQAPALAEGVVTALTDKERARIWARNGFDYVKNHFSSDIVRAAWLRFLEDLIAMRSHCPPWRRAGYALHCLQKKWAGLR